MKRILISIMILLIYWTCGQKGSRNKSESAGDTTMLDYPVLVFDVHNQCRLHLHDPNDKQANHSYSQDYVAVKFDDLAKEIFIESSKNGKDIFYSANTSYLFPDINGRYLKDGYKFYWIDTNGTQRRLRVIDKTNFSPTTQEITDTSTETVWTRSEFDSFKRKLKFSPKDYYGKFLLKNQIPKFDGDYPGIENHELTMKDYYAIFQSGYPFTYPRCHPFCFLAYKEYENFTQFFIHNYVEAAGCTIYLIHLNDTGKVVFKEPIWGSGGDGGDYFDSKNVFVTQSSAGYTDEVGYWNEDPEKPEYRIITNRKFYFDKYGMLRKKTETETKEGNYLFDIYDPSEWFPEEKNE